MKRESLRLAIVMTHPIQYYAPWLRYIQRHSGWTIRVFYLWDAGVRDHVDPDFGRRIAWDIPLLDSYPYEFVPNLSPRSGTNRPWGLWNPRLVSAVRAFAPDAVLLNCYNFATIYQFLAQWRRHEAPLLLRGDSHRLTARRGKLERLRRAMIATIFGRFAACLSVGSANRQYFEYHGVPSDRIFFSPHAVDNERFMAVPERVARDAAEWRRELGIPSNHRVILFAGKFEPNKRPVDLARAYVAARVPDTSLLFVGSGPLEAEIRQAVAGVEHVYFAPFQNQTLMPRTYAAGDVFVLPSGSESWGLAINECQCVGTPVIVSSQVGCAADLVRSGENGIVFEAGNVEALTAALRESLSDDDRLRRWGAVGRVRISRYSYENATRGLQQALEMVVKP